MNRDVVGSSQYQQVCSQASLSTTVTQKNRKNRLSLTHSQKLAGSVSKNETKRTDVFTSLISPPKMFSQGAGVETKQVDGSSDESVYIVETNNKNDMVGKSLKEETLQYCPTCQMPFKNVRILPSVHAAQCDVKLGELPECSEGEDCSSTSVFHYRDYAHTALANVRAIGKSPAPVHSNSRVVNSALKVQKVKKKLTYSDNDSDCNSSSTKSLNWLLSHSQAKLPSVLCEPAELSACSSVEKNIVPPERSCEKWTLDTEEINLLQNSSSFKDNFCGREREPRTNCSNGDGLGSIQQSRNGTVETCRVPCGSACLEGHEFDDDDDGFEKSTQASLSVVLSPDKDGKVLLESPVKIQVSCSKDGWEEVGFDACPGASIGNVKVTVCECSKNMEVNCVVGDSRVTVNSSNFKVSTIMNKRASHSATHNCASSDKNSGPSTIASSLSSKQMAESSSCASTTSTVERLDSTTEECKENIISHNRNLLAKDQWQQLMPRLRDKEVQIQPLPLSRSIETSSSVSTGSVYKSCPHYKRVPDTSFVVDAFKNSPLPGITTYFLTHFHADHYGGLRKSFNRPIYCSSITAALVRLKLRVDEKYIRKIDVDETRCISGVLVTALDANHCPGSLMFLFQLKDGRNFLHVGDFRADPKMESYPCFWNITIDRLYLDTTYCHPKHTFPPQCEMVAKVVDIVSSHINRAPETLIVCGTYTIGKEKVFIAIAEMLNCKLWARADKRKVLECIQDPDITRRLVNNPSDARVHVCPMADLNFETLSSYLKQYSKLYSNILAFKPSGWELSAKGGEVNCVTRGNIKICGVPYSEHSSFTELERFVKFLKPKEVFPTVNVSSLSTMQKYFKVWLSENPLKRRSEESTGVQAKLTKYIVRQKSFS